MARALAGRLEPAQQVKSYPLRISKNRPSNVWNIIDVPGEPFSVARTVPASPHQRPRPFVYAHVAPTRAIGQTHPSRSAALRACSHVQGPLAFVAVCLLMVFATGVAF